MHRRKEVPIATENFGAFFGLGDNSRSYSQRIRFVPNNHGYRCTYLTHSYDA